jgi:HAE1 family hydrophobic/amphiphilic exporter-1
MNISAPFITRPVMTILVMAALVLFGLLGYFSMPVSDLPNVDFPTIQVTANLSGASPETMASAVAQPLENSFATIPGITSMTSSSSLGQTQITMQFDLDRSIDGAAQDVQASISQTQKKLPQDMQNPPSYKKVNPADNPIMYLTLSSDVLPMSEVDEYAENMLAQQLSMLSGVAQVDIYGSQKFAVRIQVDPDKLASHQLSFDQVVNAVQNNNVNLPTGMIDGPQQLRTIKVDGQLFNAKDYQPLIVTYQNGQALRLEQIANVVDSVANNQVASWTNSKRSIMLAVRRQPGTNTLAVIAGIKKVLPQFRSSLPKTIHMQVMYDRSESIKSSVHEVQSNLVIAAILVVLVIFLFLKNLSATIIPAVVLPVTIIGTFAFMSLFGFSIDNISLMGLTLAVGFFVDDAIVMLENILRHMEMGKSAFQAAVAGSKEIGFTIVSMTLSLAAAFIPLVFMPGILGRLLHEFSVTLLISIAISAFVSLTLTPMMASSMLKIKHVNTGFLATFDAWFQKVHDGYKKYLRLCLEHQKLVLYIWFGCIVLTVMLYWLVPKGFIPSEDTGIFIGSTEAALDTSFTAMIKLQSQAAEILQKDPAIDAVMSVVNNHNTGRLFLRLKPRDERDNWETVLSRLRKEANVVPGLKVYIQAQASITVGGKATKSQYQYSLQGTDLDELYKYGNALYERLRSIPELVDVTTDAEMTSPQLKVSVDRDKAASMNVSMATIQNTLSYALASPQISTIYTQSDQFEVIIEVAPALQNSVDIVKQIYVRSDDGKNLIPLSALASFENTVGPEVINHQNQTPSLTVYFNVKEGVSLGDAVATVNQVAQNLNIPDHIIKSFQGNAKAFQDSLKGYGLLIFLAIAVIYILLGILYESFVHPFTILSTLPTAGIGALITLIVAQTPLDLYGFIGLLMLIGIVKKNAIMMIDFALVDQRQGRAPIDAIYEACVIRFRPIMMTTFAAFMGALPIVLAMGSGASARRALGLAVTGGLLTSQILTLFSTPVIYLYMEKLRNRVIAWRKRRVDAAC